MDTVGIISTIIISLIIASVLYLVLRRIIKNLQVGKGIDGCSGNCSECKGCGIESNKSIIKTAITIKGMSCSMCEAHINDAIRNNFPVLKVKSSYTNGVCIVFSDNFLIEENLKNIIQNLGYEVVDINVSKY